jgi:recombinational DNA repair protein RecT
MDKLISRGLFGPKEAAALERQKETAIRQDPKLAECEEDSLYGGLIAVVNLNLSVDKALDQASLVPHWNEEKKRLECVFKLGGRGLAELRRRCYGDDAPLLGAGEAKALEAAYAGQR